MNSFALVGKPDLSGIQTLAAPYARRMRGQRLPEPPRPPRASHVRPCARAYTQRKWTFPRNDQP